MSKSEAMLSRLIEISNKNTCDLIEACVIFCEEMDIDEKEFIEKLDKNTIDQIKYNAIKEGKVRKCVATLGSDLMSMI